MMVRKPCPFTASSGKERDAVIYLCISASGGAEYKTNYETGRSGGRSGQTRSRRAATHGTPRPKMGNADPTATATPVIATMKLEKCDSFAEGSRWSASFPAARNATAPTMLTRTKAPRTTTNVRMAAA